MIRIKQRLENQNLYQLIGEVNSGVDMEIETVLIWIQSLIILGIFLLIIATGFKVWAWNYVTPPR
ncbi:MAG: hypothetical protein MUO26_01585 [Methanotrichaceae archaeon]|nr:hypothetical protein [Methanotrichaceae archaeon]